MAECRGFEPLRTLLLLTVQQTVLLSHLSISTLGKVDYRIVSFESRYHISMLYWVHTRFNLRPFQVHLGFKVGSNYGQFAKKLYINQCNSQPRIFYIKIKKLLFELLIINHKYKYEIFLVIKPVYKIPLYLFIPRIQYNSRIFLFIFFFCSLICEISVIGRGVRNQLSV